MAANLRKRIRMVDCSRAVCMLWLIGIWHMSEYLDNDIASFEIFKAITNGTMSSFVFISGYFLGWGLDQEKPFKERCIQFYKKRLARFYPLFMLSCISLYLAWVLWKINYISSLSQLLLTLLGLSCIITPAPYTIWFISMLLLFYAVTPLISQFKKKWTALVLIFIIFLVLDLIIGIEAKVIMLWPFYAAGLLARKKIQFTDIFNRSYVIFGCLCGGLFIIINLLTNTGAIYVLKEVSNALFTVFILCVGHLCTLEKHIVKLLTIISYASMCTYLFHRQIFGAVYLAIGNFPVLAAYLLILPLTIGICLVIQFIYDRMCNSLSK